jgi:hypothetical protein
MFYFKRLFKITQLKSASAEWASSSHNPPPLPYTTQQTLLNSPFLSTYAYTSLSIWFCCIFNAANQLHVWVRARAHVTLQCNYVQEMRGGVAQRSRCDLFEGTIYAFPSRIGWKLNMRPPKPKWVFTTEVLFRTALFFGYYANELRYKSRSNCSRTYDS